MKYRKKPVVIEAVQFTGGPVQGTELVTWILGEGTTCSWCSADDNGAWPETFRIETLEGTMTASLGDWIIRGVKGEFYPCQPDIFFATYEEVE